MKKYLVSLTIVALLGVFFASCKEKDKDVKQEVKSITIDPTTKEVFVGDSFEFSVKVDPANIKSVCSVDKADVVKLEGKKVTALAEGTAVITAKAGSKSATLTVVVKPKNVVTTGSGKVITDVYFPHKDKFTQEGMKEEKSIIFDQMTQLGWENQAFSNDPDQKVVYPFWATKEDLQNKKKFIGLVQYAHNPQSGPAFMVLRALINPGSLSEETAKAVLDMYGFVDNFQVKQHDTLGTLYFADNTELGLGGAVYAQPTEDKKSDILSFEVIALQSQSRADFQPKMKDFRFEKNSLVSNINALLK